MRLACNAPDYLWDEFCATAAYLTALTASSSINGRTPFELWFGHAPSLTHLREIGCRAFALILTHNPKLLQRSVPCVLIGYAPHAKAYHLWNPASGRVFNSYHVTFVEHLDAIPADLLPGTLVNVDAQGLPPSWDSTTPGIVTSPSSPLPSPSGLINPFPSSIGNSSQNSSTYLPSSSLPSHSPTLIPPILPTNLPITPPIPDHLPSNTIPLDTPTSSSSSSVIRPSIAVAPPSPPPHAPSPPPCAPSPPLPQLRCSPRTHVPFSHEDSRDGLLPDTRLSGALSDVRASALHRQEECTTRRATRLSWQPIIFSASSHVHSSHVHSHMLHHVVSHLTGHMTHHVIHHMIS